MSNTCLEPPANFNKRMIFAFLHKSITWTRLYIGSPLLMYLLSTIASITTSARSTLFQQAQANLKKPYKVAAKYLVHISKFPKKKSDKSRKPSPLPILQNLTSYFQEGILVVKFFTFAFADILIQQQLEPLLSRDIFTTKSVTVTKGWHASKNIKISDTILCS